MIDVTPDPIAFELGPLRVAWYGLAFALALTVGTFLAQREAARRGENPRIVVDGLLIVVVLTVIGARLYHVIDQFQIYAADPLRIVLPPYSGLGLYGGIAGAVLGLAIFTRRRGLSFLRWGDIAVPGLLMGQAIARWGNFFNQELYGPPTNLPWGIAIDCQHRVVTAAVDYSCDRFPLESTGFHPLFFYEAALTFTGALIALFVARRFAARLRDGDLVSFWFIWYGAVRGILEVFREGYNWTFFGVPMAMLIGALAVAGGIITIIWRHRKPRPETPEPAPLPVTTLPPPAEV